MGQQLLPNLWFNTEAEAAAEYYVSIFNDGEIGPVTQYDELSAKAAGQPVGSTLTVPLSNWRGSHFWA